MAPVALTTFAVLHACCFGAAFASSGGLRGGTSDLPAAREDDTRAGPPTQDAEEFDKVRVDSTAAIVSEVPETEDFVEEDEFAAAVVGADIAVAHNETPDDMQLFVNDSFDELTASAQWHRGSRSRSRNIMTLYHTTSPSAASSILRSSFRPGHSGWCGGAIYFVATPYLPRSKYGPDTESGAVIQATVDLGRVAYMDRRCHSGFGTGIGAARRAGFDSIRFNPGDGDEYVIISASRILSMRRYQ